MAIQDHIEALIGPSVEAMGFEIVRVRVSDGGSDRLVQIMADKPGDDAITINECTDISHAVSAILDVEDPIAGAYRLEVGSAGMDRPLTKAEHYTRFTGQLAKVETAIPLGGRRRFKGLIKDLEEDIVVLEGEEETYRVPLNQIQEARLVITDEMIRAAKQRAKERAKAAQ